MKAETGVAVTGATGFIGGRLVEVLWLKYGLRSHCLVHNLTHCARLSRMPVPIVKTPALEAVSAEMLRGVEIVFHCAFGAGAAAEQTIQLNLEGTRRLALAARAAGVRRFVHLSSTAVYGFAPQAVCDESSPLHAEGDPYVDTKVAIEQMLAAEFRDLSYVILRPSIVFGPWGVAWTEALVQALQTRLHPVVDGSPAALCNTTYVDNLVEAMLLVADHPGVSGQAFNVTDGAPVPWEEYMAYHAALCRVPMSALPRVERRRLEGTRKRLARLRRGGLWPLYYDETWRGWARRFKGHPGADTAAGRTTQTAAAARPVHPGQGRLGKQLRSAAPWYVPELLLTHYGEVRMAALACAAEYPITRLSAIGYKPPVPLDEALTRTAAWLRSVHMVP